jgi:hypothetical protein
MHALFKHDTYLCYLPFVSTLSPLDDGLDMVEMLRLAVLCLVLVYLYLMTHG